MFNPRGVRFEDDGYPESGLLRLYKNFRDWCARQQAAMVKAGPHLFQWVGRAWCPCYLWRAATGIGFVGLIMTIGLLLSEVFGTGPTEALAKAHEPAPRVVPTADLNPPATSTQRIIEEQPPLDFDALVGPLTPYEPTYVAPPFERPSMAIVIDRTVTSEFSNWPDQVYIEDNRQQAGRYDVGSLRFPLGSLWRDANGRPINRPAPLPNPYAARSDVRWDASQLTNITVPSEEIPAGTLSRDDHPVAFEAYTRWPDEVALGKTALLELIVRNVSGRDLDEVRILHDLEPLDRVSDTSPKAAVVGRHLVWEEVDWPSGEQRTYTIMAVSDGRPLRGKVSVEVVNALAAATTAVVNMRRTPSFDERLAPDPDPTLPADDWTIEPRRDLPPADTLPEDTLPADDFPMESVQPNPFVTEALPDDTLPADTLPLDDGTLDVQPIDSFPSRPPRQTDFRTTTTLELKMVLGEAKIGDVSTINFRITNVGQVTSKNTRLLVTLPTSLKHPNGRDLILEIGQLAPGKSFQTDLYADVLGTQKLRVVAATDAENAARQEADGRVPVRGSVSSSHVRRKIDRAIVRR